MAGSKAPPCIAAKILVEEHQIPPVGIFAITAFLPMAGAPTRTRVTTDICLVFPTISAVEAGYEVQAVLDASGSSFAIGEETSRRRMERAGAWLTSANTIIAELVGNWATPQGTALVPLLASDPPMLPVD